MSEIEKYYKGEIIVDFEEETELEKEYNKLAELYSKAVKKKIEYRKEIERLNNIINELKIILRQKGIEITIYDQPNYEKISGYVSITMTPEQLKKELKGVDKE